MVLLSDRLDGLASDDRLKLLNAVDSLRSQGISRYLSLPQIIVCGDQSSGKSSVLEAISGVPFPVQGTLCTRFPTELVLRRADLVSVTVSIRPHDTRPEAEQASLSRFEKRLESFDGLDDIVESAKVEMGISMHGKAFAQDRLRIEITGPDRPHLTIVDLPGLIHTETKHQSATDVELIQDLVKDYMHERRSIILAVVSAKNDYANQVVLKLARKADPLGHRTLGVITKPDSLTPGSENERSYITLARNQDIEFRLGWHVLKNLDSEKEPGNLSHRDMKERLFFSETNWVQLSPSTLNITNLRSRLSKVLHHHIATELPSLLEEIDNQMVHCKAQLERLGQPRETLKDQQSYLLHASQHFQKLVRAATDATYNESFFGDTTERGEEKKYLRAVIQNLGLRFASTLMNHRGKNRSEDERDELLDHIQNLMRQTRGRELPGTFNPMIVAKLFTEKSTSWEVLANSYVKDAWKASRLFLRLVISQVVDDGPAKALLVNVVEPCLGKIQKAIEQRTLQLLKPRLESHPITYNENFTQTLLKLKRDRYRQEVLSIIRQANHSKHYSETCNCDFGSLLDRMALQRDFDVDRLAAMDALDCLDAYYEVARKRFVDDVAVQVVEAELVEKLSEVFSPMTVWSMPDELVGQIAGEGDEARNFRDGLTKQLNTLERGLNTCRLFLSEQMMDAEFRGLRIESPPSPTVDTATASETSEAHEPNDSDPEINENIPEIPRSASPEPALYLDPVQEPYSDEVAADVPKDQAFVDSWLSSPKLKPRPEKGSK